MISQGWATSHLRQQAARYCRASIRSKPKTPPQPFINQAISQRLEEALSANNEYIKTNIMVTSKMQFELMQRELTARMHAATITKYARGL